MKNIIFSLLIVCILSVSACSSDIETGPNPERETQTAPVYNDDIFEEEQTMRREFCVVVDLQKDFFTVKNTVGESYRIDNSFLDRFQVGDEVLLIYSERRSLGENVFEAEVMNVFPDESTLVYPAK